MISAPWPFRRRWALCCCSWHIPDSAKQIRNRRPRSERIARYGGVRAVNAGGNTESKYSWRAKTPVGIQILGSAITLINLVFIVVAAFAADGDWMIILPIVGMLAAAVFGVLLARSRIYFTLDGQTIRLGLWPLASRIIPLRDIEHWSYVATIEPRIFGGVGFRRTSGGNVGFLWGPGQGIEIRTVAGRSVSIVLEDAAEVR